MHSNKPRHRIAMTLIHDELVIELSEDFAVSDIGYPMAHESGPILSNFFQEREWLPCMHGIQAESQERGSNYTALRSAISFFVSEIRNQRSPSPEKCPSVRDLLAKRVQMRNRLRGRSIGSLRHTSCNLLAATA
jgi:hypothetical protein